MKSNLLTFSFHCVVSKKSSLTQCYLNFLCYLLNFRVLGFTFGSVINFELIIIECIKSVSRYIFWHVDVQLFQPYLLRRLSFLHWIAFISSSKIRWPYLWVSISGLSILIHWSICLDYCKSWSQIVSVLCFVLQYCLGYSCYGWNFSQSD